MTIGVVALLDPANTGERRVAATYIPPNAAPDTSIASVFADRKSLENRVRSGQIRISCFFSGVQDECI
jgi:hypothetical protein